MQGLEKWESCRWVLDQRIYPSYPHQSRLLGQIGRRHENTVNLGKLSFISSFIDTIAGASVIFLILLRIKVSSKEQLHTTENSKTNLSNLTYNYYSEISDRKKLICSMLTQHHYAETIFHQGEPRAAP